MVDRKQSLSKKPWCDSNGKTLSNEMLRQVSRSWSQVEWEEYLQSIETPLQEVLLPNYDRVAQKHDIASGLESFQSAVEETEENSSPVALSAVRKALLILTHKQRRAIELCILQNLSLTEASDILGTNPKSVGTLLERAFTRLHLVLDPQISNHLRKTKSEEISEVSL